MSKTNGRLIKYGSIGNPYELTDNAGNKVLGQIDIYRKGRNKFEITNIPYLCNLFEEMGSKVIAYILKNKNIDNMVIATIKDIANKTGLSLPTVFSHIKTLEKAGLIKRKQGIIMLDPRVAHKGNWAREKKLLNIYENFGKRKKDGNEK